jgi:hypothetical protein
VLKHFSLGEIPAQKATTAFEQEAYLTDKKYQNVKRTYLA